MKKIYFNLVLVLLFSCLGENNKTSIDEISIDISKVKENEKLYADISNYDFISLKQDSLIKLGEVNKIIFHKNKIYISDSRKAKSLFIYDENGNLLRVINRVGRGVGEYVNLRDFNLDKITDDIYILDPQLRKILIYDSSGVYIRDIKLEFIASTFAIVGEYLIFDKFNMMERKESDVINRNLLICDKRGKILNGFLPIVKELSAYSMGPINGLQENNNSLINYLPPLSSDFYSYDLEHEELVHQLHIDFGDNWADKTFFKSKPHPAKIVKLMTEKNLINFLNYSENDHFIRIGFYHGTDKIIGYISKEDHSYHLYNVNNNLFELLPFSKDRSGNFVNVIYPEIVKSWDQKNLIVPENIKNSKSVVLFKYSFNKS